MSLEPKHHLQSNKEAHISKEHSLDINMVNATGKVNRDYERFYTKSQGVGSNHYVTDQRETLLKITFYGKYIFYIILGIFMPVILGTVISKTSPVISQLFNSLRTTDEINAIPKTTILREANFQGVNFSQANFTEFDLERVDFHNTNLYKATLKQANLQEANLQEANLQEANLQEANLQGANLQGTNLRGANLEQVKLGEAYYSSSTKWPDDQYVNKLKNQKIYLIAPKSDLVEANLEKANLQEANLKEANLEDANLQGANLQGANLKNSNLKRANLRNANLQGANLQGVRIDYAILESANLKDAKF